MEIDISSFFAGADAFEFSHSRMEGGENAGRNTWDAAKREGAESPLLTTPEQFDALRSYVKGFGAWDESEIAAWDAIECNALFVQLISGDMREAGLDSESDDSAWDEYEANDSLCHHIFRGDDGAVYYYLGD